MDPNAIEIVLKYFPDLNKSEIDQLHKFTELFTIWNKRINLVSRKDINNLFLHHVLHSLAIAKFFPFKPGSRILDAGTGGGFPGIPLAIIFPEIEFCLADSIGKKINAVSSITADLGLSNTSVIKTRIEDHQGSYDFVVSRAVTTLQTMVSWVSDLFNEISNHSFHNGLIYLKGGDLTEELRPFGTKATVFQIKEIFHEPFFKTKKIIYLSANKWKD